MIVSTIVSIIAFTTIIVVTIVLVKQTRNTKYNLESNLRDVVDQINTSQQYTYEFDKHQQQQVIGLENNMDDVRSAYITKNEIANKLKTKQVSAENIDTQQISLLGNNWNNGSIQFNSQINNSSQSSDYMIQRGGNDKTKNHLVIKTPAEQGAALNIMSSDGQSRMMIDSSSGQINIPGNIKTNTLQIEDKFKFIGGKDDWLHMFGSDNNDYYGGLATAKLQTRDNAFLNGTTSINGIGNISGNLYISGGKSEHNPNKLQSKFPSKDDNYNYIRGDTEIRGNTNNIGDINAGRNLTVNNSLNVEGSTSLSKTVKINHSINGWQDNSPLTVYTKPGEIGASFGAEGWSHFPWTDGNTYIRPGQNNQNIIIGDWGAANVNIGRGNTNTNISGTLNVNNPGSNWLKMSRKLDDEIYLGADDTNKGIWNQGSRDFSIYTSGANRMSINKDGKIINRGDTVGPSIGRDINDNDLFKINSQNANNEKHPGTAVYQGMSINNGGGLSVGELKKMPEGQAYVRDAIKVRHNMDGTDNAAISTWTPDETKIGASFGGPDNWSYFPWTDGNTYIRSGKNNGSIMVGDTGTGKVAIGHNGTTSVNIGESWLPHPDGNTYIRPGMDGKDINIGDDLTNNINIGKSGGKGNVYTKSKTHYVGQEIDATDSWETSGKTIFTGWNSDKVVLGNNNTASKVAINKLPKNTVVSANNLNVIGKATASTQLCINDTCIDERTLGALAKIV